MLAPEMWLLMQAALDSSATATNKLGTHSSLPSTHAAPSAASQKAADAKILRSVSWARQLELQEPPHDDSYDSPHMAAHMGQEVPPAVPGCRPASFLHPGDGDGAVSAASGDGGLLNDSRSRRQALDAYYKAKQAAAPLTPQPEVVSATPAAFMGTVSQEGSLAPPFSAQSTAHSVTSSGLASQSSSASAAWHAAQEVVGPPARRVSLSLPQTKAQAGADALTPGKPGLKSQLSQMMQEVAQARSEVQGVQSQLSVHSRLGLRSGSTASSFVGSDFAVDVV